MEKQYEPLFTPWKIGKCEIKNRIVQTSMGGTSIFGWMKPNHFDKESARFLLERARNNCGLILPGIAPIRDTMGGKWLYQGKGKYKKLKAYMDEFHKTGAKMFIQLTAGMGRAMAVNNLMVNLMKNKLLGFLMKPIFNMDFICASASATPNRWADGCPSRPLTKKQINKIVEAFAKTAKLCQEAGVDGVEIHAVHEGYTLDQFAMKYTNQRTDEYGGSLENRLRFATDIVKAIKKLCGNDFPVTLRYSVVSYTKGFRQGAVPGEKHKEAGRDMAESEKAARILQEAGYDMLNCDNGTYDAWYWAHPPLYMPNNCNLEDVAHIKQFVDIPVVCAGKMTPGAAAEAIRDGRIDAMGVARQFLTDPQWVTKLMEGREDEIRPCINCHNACFTMCKHGDSANDQTLEDAIHMARCALNPQTMQSGKYKIVPARKPKTVAIIGGGIGGMEAALVLKARGHKPVIYEKSDTLGGTFIQAAAFSYKEHDKRLIQWYRNEIASQGIPVKFNTEISAIDDLKEDRVLIATGGKPNRPRIPGLSEYAIEPLDFLSGKKPVGDNVLIIGGGLTGCEIAYELVLQGKKPQIVEMLDDLISAKGVCLANSSFLREMLAFKKVPVHLRTKLVEVTPSGAKVQALDGNKTNKQPGKQFEIKADSVITCMGYHPSPLAAKPSSKVRRIGDALEVGNLRTTIWSAWDAAMKI